MTPTVRSDPKQAGNAETMESWTTSPLFPLTAGAVGALTTFALLAVDSPAASAIALGLGVFAALMTLRNWWTAEEERPLLAEELLGLHDGADAMREDAADLRLLLTELAEVVEQSVAAREAAPALTWRDMETALDDRIGVLERRLAEIAETAEGVDPAAQTALAADLSTRAHAAEERAQKLAKALAIAVREMKRLAERVDALEAGDGAAGTGETAQAGAPEQDDEIRGDAARENALFALANELSADRAERISGTEEAAEDTAEAAASRASAGPERPAADPPAASSGHETVMQAIVTLPDGAPRYLEAVQDVEEAHGARLNGAAPTRANGRAPRRGELTLARAAAALDDISARGRDAGVFCALSLESLRDDGFLRALLALLERRPGVGDRLVFELDQAEIAAASAQDLALLQRVRQKGFSFALARVGDWKADIAEMARIGFRFVKLDCAALLTRDDDAPGAAERLIASFDRVGIELVVEDVETEAQRARVTAAGVRLAQGASLAPTRRIRFDGGEQPAQPGSAAVH